MKTTKNDIENVVASDRRERGNLNVVMFYEIASVDALPRKDINIKLKVSGG